MLLSTRGGVLRTIAVRLVRPVGLGLFLSCSLADVLRLRLAGGSPEQQAIAGSTIMGWPGTPLLAGYRDGGQSTKYDPDMTMTARCASATNPVAPGTASVIPPSKTQVAVPDEALAHA